MDFFTWIFDPQAWIVLITLTTLEIILGIDNIIVINILVSKLPVQRRSSARLLGLALAMISRVILLLMLFFLASLVKPLFYLGDFVVSSRDLVLGIGGIFLVYKAIREIWELINPEQQQETIAQKAGGVFMLIIMQIILIDIVFSLDSVITAIGIAKDIPIMILAVVISIIIMMTSVNWIGQIVDKYPAVKMVALTFIVLVGIILVIEAIHLHVDKSYLYAAMGFAVLVQYLIIMQQKANNKLKLKIKQPDEKK